jgi:hypothetical protein
MRPGKILGFFQDPKQKDEHGGHDSFSDSLASWLYV